MPLGEDMRTETASIQNFKSNVTNEKLKGRNELQIPQPQNAESSLLARQRSREQILTQRKPGSNSTFEKYPERANIQGAKGRIVQGMTAPSQEEMDREGVDVLSRSASENSSHNDADVENSEADSRDREIEYFRKQRRSRKQRVQQNQPDYGEEYGQEYGDQYGSQSGYSEGEDEEYYGEQEESVS